MVENATVSEAAAAIRALRPFDLYKDHKSGVTEKEFRAMCGTAPIWHSVDLGDLFIEGVRKSGAVTATEMEKAQLPDLRGKSVLDIGAFGGWFSFEAERRGAARVVAIDYHSWVVDNEKIRDFLKAEKEAGRIGNAYALPPHLVDEVGQPGRAVFDATKKLLGSKVEPVLAKVEEYVSDPFDVVFYLGVLYHSENPLDSIRKVAALTKECLIIETLGSYFPGLENRAVFDFFGDDRINFDNTTWWSPNNQALTEMLKAAGFSRVEIKSSYETLPEEKLKRPQLHRIWGHAWK